MQIRAVELFWHEKNNKAERKISWCSCAAENKTEEIWSKVWEESPLSLNLLISENFGSDAGTVIVWWEQTKQNGSNQIPGK